MHDIDGRARRVDYVADALGFRAVVNTNEPGTAHSAPAASLTASPYAAPVAPVAHAPVALAHAAPLAYAHSAPLAVAHAAPVAYSAHHVAAAPIAHAPLLAGHGLLGAGHLSYSLGGIGHHGFRSFHY